MADKDKIIQGYSGGVFWERNSLNEQNNGNREKQGVEETLFSSKLL